MTSLGIGAIDCDVHEGPQGKKNEEDDGDGDVDCRRWCAAQESRVQWI